MSLQPSGGLSETAVSPSFTLFCDERYNGLENESLQTMTGVRMFSMSSCVQMTPRRPSCVVRRTAGRFCYNMTHNAAVIDSKPSSTLRRFLTLQDWLILY